jgi:hypothetical protein
MSQSSKEKDQSTLPDDSDTVENLFLRDADEVRPVEKIRTSTTGLFSRSLANKAAPSINDNKNHIPKPGKS